MLRLVLSALLGAIVALPAAAQEQPLAQKVERLRARDEARAAAATAQPGMVIDVTPRAPVADEPFCLPISAINVEGVTLLPQDAVNAALSDYANACMGQGAIDTLLQVLTDLYLARGYITSRAYIPEQSLANGRLTLVVVEGFVEDVAFARTLNGTLDTTPNPRRVTAALPLKPGDPLELRALEQGMEQMNAVPSANVAVDIQPGTQLGGSILVIKADDSDVLRGRVSYLTGRGGAQDQTIGLSLTADNLLQANDTWSASFNGGVNSNALTFGLTLPIRNWTLTGSYSYSEQLSQLTATTELFEQTNTARLSARRLLTRNATQKTYLAFALTDTRVARSVNGTALTEQGNTALSLDLAREIVGQGRFTSLGLGLTAAKRTAGGPGYGFATLSASHSRSFGTRWGLYSTFDAQIAGNALPSNHQFFIGGGGVVRGFQGGSLSGDSGFSTSHELSASLADFTPKGLDPQGPQSTLTTLIRATQPYAFLDAGMVRATGQKPSSMLSAGVGLRSSFKGFGLDFGVAFPVSATGAARKNGPGLRLSLSRFVF